MIIKVYVRLLGAYRSNAVRLPCQDHRNVKSRTKVMLFLKQFKSTATTISGIELTRRIHEGSTRSRKADPQGCRCVGRTECYPVRSIRYPAYRKLIDRLTCLQ
ncbi:hypothetical protein DR64_8077 [Paraburkholderia xenovorans LB400]|nr:hypothetical protein DR64_8077 [Paraburkholderia xenovorans LB400]